LILFKKISLSNSPINPSKNRVKLPEIPEFFQKNMENPWEP
jgi:hypothetical protein